MDSYSNISKDLKEFFSTNSFFKVLLPLDVVILFGGLVLNLLCNFISCGAFAYSLSKYACLIGFLLTYANRKDLLLSYGFFGVAAINILSILHDLFNKYYSISCSDIIDGLIFGFIGYLILKRSYK